MNLRQIIRNQKLQNFSLGLGYIINEADDDVEKKDAFAGKTKAGSDTFWYVNKQGKMKAVVNPPSEAGWELANKEQAEEAEEIRKDVKVDIDDEARDNINQEMEKQGLKSHPEDENSFVDKEGNEVFQIGADGEVTAGSDVGKFRAAEGEPYAEYIDDLNKRLYGDEAEEPGPDADDEETGRPETALQASAGGPNVKEEVEVSKDGSEVTIKTSTGTPPPELKANPQTPESIRALRDWQKSEDGLGKNKDCNEVSPVDPDNPAESFTQNIQPDNNAFSQEVKGSKTLTAVGDPEQFSAEVVEILSDAGIEEPYPFPKQYVELLGRLVNTNSSSVDSAKIGEFIEGAGAGMIRSQAGEVMTMMITTLPEEQAIILTDKVREATEAQDKKTRIVDPSWADAALKNREAILSDVRSTYGPDAKISAGAWDVKGEVLALGMAEPFEENKGYSTDAYFRVELEGDNSDAGPQLVEASLKKDLSVYFYNGGMTKAYKPVEQGGMGLDAEAMAKAHKPPPENFEDYNFDDYSQRRNQSFNEAGQVWSDLSNARRKNLITTMMNPADPPKGAGKEASKDFADAVKAFTNPRTIAAAGTKDPDKMALFMLGQLNNFKEDGSFDKTDAVGPQDRVMKAVLAIGDRPTRSGTDRGRGEPFGDVVRKVDEDHKNFGRDFAAAVITNESLRNSILESIRREFPIKACADGEEIMAIGDLTINRAVCQELFGTSNFNEIQENLQIRDIKGKPTIVYQATAPGVDPIPISLIEAREKGKGYSAMSLNLKLAESGLRGPLQRAQAALQEVFNALLKNILSEMKQNTLAHHIPNMNELNKASLN